MDVEFEIGAKRKGEGDKTLFTCWPTISWELLFLFLVSLLKHFTFSNPIKQYKRAKYIL